MGEDSSLGQHLVIENAFLENDGSGTVGPVLIQPSGASQSVGVTTIDLGAEINDVGEAGPDEVKWFAPVADISWTQGRDARYSATVDIARGTQLTLGGGGVVVRVRSPAPDPVLPGVTAVPFARVTLSASIVWGTRPSKHPVTRTFSPVTLAAATADTVKAIPNFAYALDLFSPLTSADFTVDFFSGNVVVASVLIHNELGAAYVLGRQSEGVKVPPTANFYRVTNNNGAERTYTASFRLAL